LMANLLMIFTADSKFLIILSPVWSINLRCSLYRAA
jgi:hypothetical protein